ncbi:uncharacterized protein LOC130174188 [Seriola aureovittata]|uniref:uncharacterized protein LOC130174188 n=1 Tax=Seriola aureovittata TaxID=2871759 RepID=UPI0024BE1A1D|nr:uncharacterized protein LOC130174188 [Seriola aureovittata]
MREEAPPHTAPRSADRGRSSPFVQRLTHFIQRNPHSPDMNLLTPVAPAAPVTPAAPVAPAAPVTPAAPAGTPAPDHSPTGAEKSSFLQQLVSESVT